MLVFSVLVLFFQDVFGEDSIDLNISMDLDSASSVVSIQNDSSSSDIDTSLNTKIPAVILKNDASEEFVNPFSTNDNNLEHSPKESAEFNTQDNPFVSTKESTFQEEVDSSEFIDSEKSSIDFQMDLTLGVNFSRIDVEPASISTEGDACFTFGFGVLAHFSKYMYLKAALHYNRLRFKTANSDSIPSLVTFHYSKETTEEELNYLSLGIDIGMRFELKTLTPYFYTQFQPSILFSSGRKTILETVYINKTDSTGVSNTGISNSETTNDRERLLFFAGGGIGLEIPYGYGIFYLDCAVLFALKDPGYKNSSPIRTSGTLMFFPISIGIRFYL